MLSAPDQVLFQRKQTNFQKLFCIYTESIKNGHFRSKKAKMFYLWEKFQMTCKTFKSLLFSSLWNFFRIFKFSWILKCFLKFFLKSDWLLKNFSRNWIIINKNLILIKLWRNNLNVRENSRIIQKKCKLSKFNLAKCFFQFWQIFVNLTNLVKILQHWC
jgi:hypothetical protein